MLPTVGNAERPVVILRMRGRTSLGTTLTDVLASYAAELDRAEGRLYLSGVGKAVIEEVGRTGKLDLTGPVRLYEASNTRGESTRAAVADAQAWLADITSAPESD